MIKDWVKELSRIVVGLIIIIAAIKMIIFGYGLSPLIVVAVVVIVEYWCFKRDEIPREKDLSKP